MVAALATEFERESGKKLDLNFGTAGSLRGRIKSGEAADPVIFFESAISELAKLGFLVPLASPTPVAPLPASWYANVGANPTISLPRLSSRLCSRRAQSPTQTRRPAAPAVSCFPRCCRGSALPTKSKRKHFLVKEATMSRSQLSRAGQNWARPSLVKFCP